jgi:hypothetical protein
VRSRSFFIALRLLVTRGGSRVEGTIRATELLIQRVRPFPSPKPPVLGRTLTECSLTAALFFRGHTQPACGVRNRAAIRQRVCLGRLEIDDELDLGLLERQVGGFVALENFTCD